MSGKTVHVPKRKRVSAKCTDFRCHFWSCFEPKCSKIVDSKLWLLSNEKKNQNLKSFYSRRLVSFSKIIDAWLNNQHSYSFSVDILTQFLSSIYHPLTLLLDWNWISKCIFVDPKKSTLTHKIRIIVWCNKWKRAISHIAPYWPRKMESAIPKWNMIIIHTAQTHAYSFLAHIINCFCCILHGI